MSESDELRRVIAWMMGRDTGLSSKTIAAAMSGSRVLEPRTPGDPADLGRCLRLLKLFPEWVPHFAETMSVVSHEWRCFAEDWPILSASMTDEVGIDWSKGESAPTTYDLMQATRQRAIETDPTITITGRREDGTIYAWTRKKPAEQTETVP